MMFIGFGFPDDLPAFALLDLRGPQLPGLRDRNPGVHPVPRTLEGRAEQPVEQLNRAQHRHDDHRGLLRRSRAHFLRRRAGQSQRLPVADNGRAGSLRLRAERGDPLRTHQPAGRGRQHCDPHLRRLLRPGGCAAHFAQADPRAPAERLGLSFEHLRDDRHALPLDVLALLQRRRGRGQPASPRDCEHLPLADCLLPDLLPDFGPSNAGANSTWNTL